MDSCAWCRRRAAHPLGAGEICEVCIGLCAFSFVPKYEAAACLYEHSRDWVEQALAYAQSRRASRELCWWCSRPGQPRPFESAAALYFEPSLCPVCDGLFIPRLPTSEGRLLAANAAYEQLCQLVTV